MENDNSKGCVCMCVCACVFGPWFKLDQIARNRHIVNAMALDERALPSISDADVMDVSRTWEFQSKIGSYGWILTSKGVARASRLRLNPKYLSKDTKKLKSVASPLAA